MALIQALMIIAPAVFITWFSLRQLLSGDLSYRTDRTALGLWTMGATMVANFGLMRYLQGVAKRTGSPSIRANATHERVDLITSMIVFAGMVLIALTGRVVLDPLLGLAAALYIFKEGWDLLYDSAQVLLDHQAPQHLIDRIHAVLHRHGQFIHTYSNVRTRLVGSQVHAEMDIQVCRDAQLGDVHNLTDHLEAEFQKAIPGIDVHIHPEPCPPTCIICPLRDHPAGLFTLLHTHTPVPEPLRAAEEELEHQAY
jgi:cation diffusion facilitator family transporter